MPKSIFCLVALFFVSCSVAVQGNEKIDGSFFVDIVESEAAIQTLRHNCTARLASLEEEQNAKLQDIEIRRNIETAFASLLGTTSTNFAADIARVNQDYATIKGQIESLLASQDLPQELLNTAKAEKYARIYAQNQKEAEAGFHAAIWFFQMRPTELFVKPWFYRMGYLRGLKFMYNVENFLPLTWYLIPALASIPGTVYRHQNLQWSYGYIAKVFASAAFCIYNIFGFYDVETWEKADIERPLIQTNALGAGHFDDNEGCYYSQDGRRSICDRVIAYDNKIQAGIFYSEFDETRRFITRNILVPLNIYDKKPRVKLLAQVKTQPQVHRLESKTTHAHSFNLMNLNDTRYVSTVVNTLHICAISGFKGVILYYINPDSKMQISTYHDSVERALAQAEYEYGILAKEWTFYL